MATRSLKFFAFRDGLLGLKPFPTPLLLLNNELSIMADSSSWNLSARMRRSRLQGDNAGPGLLSVDFILNVSPGCQASVPVLPSQASSGTLK